MLFAASISMLMGQAIRQAPDDAGFGEFSLAQIRDARASVAGQEALPSAEKARIIDLYDMAIQSLEAVPVFLADAERFGDEAVVSPARIRSLQAELATPVGEVKLTLPQSVMAIEEQLIQARAELAAAREALADEDRLSAQRFARRGEISVRLGILTQHVTQVEDQLSEVMVTELRPALRDAQQARLLAQRRELQAEMLALHAELKRHVARAPTLPLRRERAKRRIALAEKTVGLLIQARHSRLRAEMQQRLETVKRIAEEAARKVPQLASAAAEAVEFAERLSGAGGMRIRIEAADADLTATRRSISEIREAHETSRRKWESVRFQGVATQWLPTVPIDLERPASLRREIGLRHMQIPEIRHEIILLEERNASSTGGRIEVDLSALSQEDAETAKTLFRQRQALLDELLSETTRYADLLNQLDSVSQELLAELEALEAFVLARILWARSVPGSIIPEASNVVGAIGWLLSVSTWLAVLKTVLLGAWGSILPTVAAISALAFLFWIRQPSRNLLHRLGDKAVHADTVTMGVTYRALGLTVLLAAPVPALLFVLSQLLQFGDQYELAQAAAGGLMACVYVCAALELIAWACTPNGLVEAHFGWPAARTFAINRNVRLALVATLPLIFVTVLLSEMGLQFYQPPELQAWNNSLGRLSFIAAYLLLAIFGYRALRPSVTFLAHRMHDSFDRLWLALLISLSLMPALLALFGYYTTSVIVVHFLAQSAGFVLILAFLYGLSSRWTRLSKRRMTERMVAFSADQPDSLSESQKALLTDEVSSRSASADSQVKQLFRFGFLLCGIIGILIIWSGFTPVLRVLDHLQVWPSIQLLSERELTEERELQLRSAAVPQSTEASGETAIAKPRLLPTAPGVLAAAQGLSSQTSASSAESNVETPSVPPKALMLPDFLMAILLFAATVLSAKNIPGLLEFSVLPRFQADAGVRVATGALIRYGIIIVGLSLAFAKLGLSWSQLQWLAAALTFGLAFGLQEIFANFVSGLILLLERPLRVGDVVTIRSTTGTVTSIRMRATTVLGWDKSELIVPNKELVTGQLVNWTLSDLRVRLELPVGVAYGSPILKVKEILCEVARNNPRVLRDPIPEVLFLKFGASALEFELRVFINFFDGRPRVLDELHEAIDNAFRENGLVIAFPQLDVHYRTLPPEDHTPPGLPHLGPAAGGDR